MNDNKTTIQAHNDRLTALVEQADVLPDAVVPSGDAVILY